MLLVLDIGNTNIVTGIYEGDELLSSFRLSTDKNKTFDEYAIILTELLGKSKIGVDKISGSIISCVVPPLFDVFIDVIKKYFSHEPIIVDHSINTGMPILLDNPEEVGPDRIVNAVSAYSQNKDSCIVVDFGTATTFDCISQEGGYLGGVICPGIMISSNALFLEASKLPRVELISPKQIIGKNTIDCIRSGIVNGYSSMVDGLIVKIKDEMKNDAKVFATGGLAQLISDHAKYIDIVDEDLTLRGLKLIYDLNV